MKDMEVAESLFREWGLSYLKREHPKLVDGIAAGRIVGAELRNGHAAMLGTHSAVPRVTSSPQLTAGPQFTLFLSETDFVGYSPALAAELNAAVPDTWKGHAVACPGDKPVQVVSTRRWFAEHFGLYDFPLGVGPWLQLDESRLYALKHAAIWMDETGELGVWREVLSRYPDAVRMKRLAEECFRVWQYGQDCFLLDVAPRLDVLSASIGFGQFIEGVMRLTLLLNDDFTPHWRWLAQEFGKQEDAARLEPLLTSLLASMEVTEQVAKVEELCAIVRQMLEDRGAITGAHDKPALPSLLNAYNELKETAGRLLNL